MALTSVPAYACRHCKTPLRRPLKPEFHNGWSADEGQRFPLGVSWLAAEQAYNFALYSLAAQTVELLFFRQGRFEAPAFGFRFDSIRSETSRGRFGIARFP